MIIWLKTFTNKKKKALIWLSKSNCNPIKNSCKIRIINPSRIFLFMKEGGGGGGGGGGIINHIGKILNGGEWERMYITLNDKKCVILLYTYNL